MTEGAKLVTSKPDSEDRDEKQALDTNRPVALVGVSHEHLENQQGETKSDKNEEEKKS